MRLYRLSYYLFLLTFLSIGCFAKGPDLISQSSKPQNKNQDHKTDINYQDTNNQTGFCFYFTGLSGSGKSTIVQALKTKIEKDFGRIVTILDGDEIRENISPELGFSKKDRSLNVRRIGYIASLIVKHGGICLCANIAPYIEDREFNRQKISQNGHYVEVFVDTPIAVCEKRDPKGLYKLVRAGKIKEFTGINDPYEIPQKPEIHLNGTKKIEANLEEIVDFFKKSSPRSIASS